MNNTPRTATTEQVTAIASLRDQIFGKNWSLRNGFIPVRFMSEAQAAREIERLSGSANGAG